MNELFAGKIEAIGLTCFYRPDVDRPQIKIPARICRRLRDENPNSDRILIALNDRCMNCDYKCSWSGLAENAE